MNNIRKVVIVGAGPAGALASILIAEKKIKDIEVVLIERNHKIGRKLYITGKGRCNITNSNPDPVSKVVSNPKFSYSAFSKFTYKDCVDFFKKRGLMLKEERGGRFFPISDKSADVIDVFYKEILKNDIKLLLNEKVIDLNLHDDNILISTNKQNIVANAVIMATGGVYYPDTGSDGLGHEILKKNNIKIISPMPALTNIILCEPAGSYPEGLSLSNVTLKIYNSKNKLLHEEFGEMLFTHDGISGPIVLTISSKINRLVGKEKLIAQIDLKPALSIEKINEKIANYCKLYPKKQIINILPKLTASRLSSQIIKQANIDVSITMSNLKKVEINRLSKALKELTYEVASLDTKRAVVTSGGVNVKEINPKNMQSKVLKALFFAGEIIDVDALTGGYNIQFALSSAYLAANGVIDYLNANENNN